MSWIRITSGASATGSAVVSYAVEANGGEGRTGTLTMAGRDFGVEQARPACLPSDLSDLSRWTVQVGPSPGTVRISGQRVELRVVSGQTQAGIVSRCSLQGDFDVQVDFQRVAFPAGSTYGLRLGARIGGQFLAVNRTPSNYSLYLGSALIAPNIPTPDASGRLRLARTATSVAGYYGSGSGWVRVGAATLGIEPATFVLDLSSGQAATPSETVVAFENFRVNTGTPVN